jgi:hypothetical protein
MAAALARRTQLVPDSAPPLYRSTNMGATPSRQLTYDELIELARLFLLDPSNREVEENFLAGCLAKITRIIEAYVFCERIPNMVIDDAVSLAQLNLVRGIRTLLYPEKLKHWLIKVARNAAVSEFLRMVTGRGEDERIPLPLETKDTEGKIVQTLDLEKHRAAAERSLAGSAKLAEDACVDVERLKIFDQILKIHMERATKKRDRDSGIWIKTILEEHLPVEEVAERRRTTRADVYHLLAHDTPLLKAIYRELLGEPKNE